MSSPDIKPSALPTSAVDSERREFVVDCLHAGLAISFGACAAFAQRHRTTPSPTRELVEQLRSDTLAGVAGLDVRVLPENPAQVLLHVRQLHPGKFIEAFPSVKRDVVASQDDLELLIRDLHVRYGVQAVFPENAVPMLMHAHERLIERIPDAPTLAKRLTRLEAALQRDIAELPTYTDPGERANMEKVIGSRLAHLELQRTELGEICRHGIDTYRERCKHELDTRAAETDACLRLEREGVIVRKLSGSDAVLQRAQHEKKSGTPETQREWIFDRRESELLGRVYQESERLAVLPYGTDHDFTAAVRSWNSRHPNQSMALLVVALKSGTDFSAESLALFDKFSSNKP